MAGISVSQCISIVLSKIGGIPLKGASTSFVEGAPNAKQLAGAMTTLPGLSTLSSVLQGGSITSALTSSFQNPIAAVSSTLGSSITSAVPGVQSLAGTFDPITGGFSGGKLSLEQVNSLTSKLNGSTLGGVLDPVTGEYSMVSIPGSGGISNSLGGLTDLTDKMSGVKLPNYEIEGDFGFQQYTSMQSAYENMKNEIPPALDTEAGGVKDVIASKLTDLSSPMNTEPTLTSTNSTVSSMVSDLNSLSGPALDAKVAELELQLGASETEITTSVTKSKSAMTNMINASDAVSYIAVASGAIRTKETGELGTTIDKVVKPDVRARIESDIATYG